MIDAEAVNPHLLPSVALSDRHDLPNIRCIYFAIDGAGDVVYVGQSNSLRHRWYGNNHKAASALQCDSAARIAYLEISETFTGDYSQVMKLNKLELALIRAFNPRMNGTPPKKAAKKGAGK